MKKVNQSLKMLNICVRLVCLLNEDELSKPFDLTRNHNHLFNK